MRHLIENGSINLGDVIICDEYIYESLKGEKIYITHGDQFDGFILIHPFLYWLGDTSYEIAIKVNKIYNFFRKIFKYDYWSLSQYLKSSVKNVIQFITEYEKWSELRVKEKGCDSILMGHTHCAKIINGKYYNTGDFVESCTYIVEQLNGDMILKNYD